MPRTSNDKPPPPFGHQAYDVVGSVSSTAVNQLDWNLSEMTIIDNPTSIEATKTSTTPSTQSSNKGQFSTPKNSQQPGGKREITEKRKTPLHRRMDNKPNKLMQGEINPKERPSTHVLFLRNTISLNTSLTL